MNRRLNRYHFLIVFETLLVSLFVAIAGFLLSEGILYFIFHMTFFEMDLVFRLLIDGGVALVSFIVTFLLYRKNKMAKAKIIDQQLHLQEKVSTMYELQNDPSEMARIQREDAIRSVEEKPKKPFRIRVRLLPLLLAFVAFVTCGITHIIPYPLPTVDAEEEVEEEVDPETPEEEEEPDVKDNNIQDIIDEIKGNENIPEDTRKEIIEDLEELDRNLADDETNEERDQDIQNTIDELEREKNEAISYDKIGEALQKYESTKNLGEAISEANGEKVKEAIDEIFDSFDQAESEEEAENLRQQVAEDISNALADSAVPSDDALFEALNSLASSLKGQGEKGEGEKGEGQKPEGEEGQKPEGEDGQGQGEGERQEQLENAKNEAKDEIDSALEEQKKIEDAFDQAIEDLKNMMSGDMPDQPMDDQNQTRPEGAGVGSGETIYGADEVLYDPETNTEVTVKMQVDEEKAVSQKVSLEDSVPNTVSFTTEYPSFAKATFTLAEEDNLKQDSVIILYSQAEKNEVKVLLVSDQPFYLSSALRTIPDVKLDVIAKSALTEVEGYDIYVFDGVTPITMPKDGAVWFFGQKENIPDSGFIIQREEKRNEAGYLEYTKKNSVSYKAITDTLKGNTIALSEYYGYSFVREFETILACDGDAVLTSKLR